MVGPARRGVWFASIVAVATAVLLCIAAAELWILPAALGMPRSTYLLGFVARGARVDDVKINALGFTGDALEFEHPPDAVRVLTLGGSALFNRRMTERLAARLEQSASRPVEVLGAALRSHTSWSSVWKYRHLSDYHFDYVLIYHGINDLYADHVASEDFRADYSHLDPWYRRTWLLRHSVIARLLYNRLVYRKPARVEAGSGFASADVLRANLETLVDETRRDGAVPVLMTFAWSIPPDYSYPAFRAGTLGYDNPERYDPCPVELWGPVAWVREGLARHDVVVRQVARERSVELIDQEQLMGKDPGHFGDACHLSEDGTDLFVEHIARAFEERGWLR